MTVQTDRIPYDAARPGAWSDRAACRGKPVGWFYPEREGDNGTRAVGVCRRCPVQTDCLTFALETHQAYGIWGGLHARARHRLLRDRRRMNATNRGIVTSN